MNVVIGLFFRSILSYEKTEPQDSSVFLFIIKKNWLEPHLKASIDDALNYIFLLKS